MGRKPSYAVYLPNKDYLCPELTREESSRLMDKIGLSEFAGLMVRIMVRDRLLEEGKKSVPKHRLNKKSSNLP